MTVTTPSISIALSTAVGLTHSITGTITLSFAGSGGRHEASLFPAILQHQVRVSLNPTGITILQGEHYRHFQPHRGGSRFDDDHRKRVRL